MAQKIAVCYLMRVSQNVVFYSNIEIYYITVTQALKVYLSDQNSITSNWDVPVVTEDQSNNNTADPPLLQLPSLAKTRGSPKV